MKEKQITIIKITIYRLAQAIIRHYRKLQGLCNTSTRRLESFYKAFVIFQNEPSWLTSKYVWGFKGGHFSLSSLVFSNVSISFIFVYLHFFSYICSLMGLHLSDKQERRRLWMTK